MSDLPAAMAATPRRETPSPSFEQRLFEWSPVGTLPTAATIFVLLVAAFESAAALTHYSLAEQLTWTHQSGGWPAVILSLLVAVALGMQRYVRQKDLEDDPALARILPCNGPVMAVDRIPRSTLRWIGLLGASLGVAASVLATPRDVLTGHFPVFFWFASVMAILGAMFARGIVMTRTAARSFAERVDRDLNVDLLRIDELFVIGRESARAALIWLSVAAVICLFFVTGQMQVLVIATVVASAGMALWIFFRSLKQVHRKIHEAKRAELDRVRRQIDAAREQADRDHVAAARLHGLIAYETRIAGIREWPFDQWTLLRVGAYVLIPAIPSIGQVAMKYFTGHVLL